MEPLNLLLVGCGMMGARHLRGIGELERVAPGTVRLAALCDVRREYAEKVAAEASELLGYAPQVFTDLEEAISGKVALDAVDLVTDPRSHDELVVKLVQAGLHVLCEKPLAVTVARGQRMIEAAAKAGRVLAVAENNRRDPMNRLAKACLEAGLIGTPHLAIQTQISAGGGILATAWRHRLAMGGILLDVPIHSGYALEMLLGPIESVVAQAQLVQTQRSGKEFDGKEVEVVADAPDCLCALLQFASGTQGHWLAHYASAGETAYRRLILGSEGTLGQSGDRSGYPLVLKRGREELTAEALLAAVPEYRLNAIETKLFGKRPTSYTLEGPVTDRKLLAAEIYDFAEAVRLRQSPEVDGTTGLRAVAIIHAMLESNLAGRRVTVAEVLSGQTHAYQDMVEAAQ